MLEILIFSFQVLIIMLSAELCYLADFSWPQMASAGLKLPQLALICLSNFEANVGLLQIACWPQIASATGHQFVHWRWVEASLFAICRWHCLLILYLLWLFLMLIFLQLNVIFIYICFIFQINVFIFKLLFS